MVLVQDFLDDAPAWRCAVQHTQLPTAGPRWSDWRDGGYYARLHRTPD